MNKQNLIVTYNEAEVTLSDGSTFTNDFILTSDGISKSFVRENYSIKDFFDCLEFLDILKPFIYNKEILLIGSGNEFIIPSFEIKKQISLLNLKLEWMPTISAIHTYNLLIEDYKNCVALFIRN